MDNSQFKVPWAIGGNYLGRSRDMDIIPAIVGECDMYHAFIKMDSSSNWGVLPPEGDRKICIKYDGCVILLHEYMFSFIGFRLPFNDFEVGILNHSIISPS